MKCIQYQSLLSPLFSQHIYTHQHRPIWLPNKPVLLTENRNRLSLTRTLALPTPEILAAAASSPSTDAGNISSLLKASAGLLFAYWIANFVVPELVLKDLQSDNTNENEEKPSKDESRK